MSSLFSLMVTDTSPLVTLALADALDVLLRPAIPVSIPDEVYIEATRTRTAAGAGRIVEWINEHLDIVRIVPTEVGIDQQRRIEEGRTIRSLGEQAALEVLERFLSNDPEPASPSASANQRRSERIVGAPPGRPLSLNPVTALPRRARG